MANVYDDKDEPIGALASAEKEAATGSPNSGVDDRGFFRDEDDASRGPELADKSANGASNGPGSTKGGSENGPSANLGSVVKGIESNGPAGGLASKMMEEGISATGGGGAGLVMRGLNKIRNNPRQSIGGFLVGIFMIGAGIAGMLYVSGPLEFVHMSKLLTGFHMSSHEDQSDVRVSRIIRYIRDPSKPQNTRLGILANNFADKFETKLNSTGVESRYKGKFGYGSGYAVDLKNDNFKGLGDAEVKAKLVSQYGVPESAISGSVKEGNIKFDVGTSYFKNAKLSKSLLKNANLSKISAWEGTRLLGKRAGVTWHPLKKADRKVLTTVTERIKAWRDARKAQIGKGGDVTLLQTQGPAADEKGNPTDTSESNAAKNSNAEVTEEAAAAANSDDPKAFEKFQGHLGTKIAGGAAAAVGIACMVKAVNDEVTTEKQAKIILPLMRFGTDAISIGSQITAGQDADTEQMKDMNALLHGKDSAGNATSWTDAASIRSNLGQEGGVKPDDTLSDLTKGGPFDKFFNATGVGGAMQAACSTGGTIVLTAFSFATGPISTIAGGVVSYFAAPKAISFIAHWFTGSGINPMAVGADYGLNADYGMVLASNEYGLANGGVAMSKEETAAVQSTSNQLSQEEFNSQSFAARTFAVSDPHSLVGKLIDSHSSSASQAVSNVASALIKIPGDIGTMFGGMFTRSKASAAAPPYDYGVPVYGFTTADMEDPSVQDPYSNAQHAAKVLDSGSGSGYIEDAKTCFNVDIIKTADVWDVNANQDSSVDAYSGNYDIGKCTKKGDKDWLSIRFFIFDTATIKGVACYEGDGQSCEDLGVVQAPDNPGAGLNGGGGQYKVGEFNLRGQSHVSGGSAKARMDKAAGAIKAEDYDIMGLQELQGGGNDPNSQRGALIANLKDTYSIFPAKGDPNVGHSAENSIIWKTEKFELLESGMTKGKYFGGSMLNMPWVKLQDKTTTQIVYISNTHDPADTQGQAAQYRAENVLQHLADASKWTGEGIPVIMTGDFNWGYNIRKGGPTSDFYYTGSDIMKSPYCQITKDNILSDAQDIFKGKSGTCPSNTKQINGPGARTVDHILVSGGLTVPAFEITTNAAINAVTDHPGIVTAVVKIPTSDDDSVQSQDTFNIATYNLLDAEAHADDSRAVGGCTKGDKNDPLCINARTANQVKIITGDDSAGNPAFDVFGTQETSPKQYVALKNALTGYSVYPSTSARLANDQDGETAIWWNSSTLSLVGQGSTTQLSNVNKRVSAPWVQLETSSGHRFYVLSVHYANTTFGGSVQQHKDSADLTLKFVKEHETAETPVFVVGDMNEHFEKGSVPKATVADAAYCRLTSAAVMQNIYDMGKGNSVDTPCPTKTNPGPGGNYVNQGKDQLFATPAADLRASGWSQPGNSGIYAKASDHMPVYATITFQTQSLSVGGGTFENDYAEACAGKSPRYGIACSGECVDFVEYRLRKHIDPKSFTSFGTGANVVPKLGSTYGYKVDNTPAVNAVVSWPLGGVPGQSCCHSAGHTAMVSQVNADGSIVVEEYNWEVDHGYGTRLIPASVAKNLKYAHTEVDYK